MYSRIETEAEPIFLPDDWCTDVNSLLRSLYGQELIDHNFTLQVYGLTYPTEVVLMVSLVNPEDQSSGAITYMASAELAEKGDPKKMLDTLVDSVGGFFDHAFSDLENLEYLALWTEAKIKDTAFHYMVTRENVALSLEATKLLREH